VGEDRPVHRLPAGERVCLDALTHPEPNGFGRVLLELTDTDPVHCASM